MMAWCLAENFVRAREIVENLPFHFPMSKSLLTGCLLLLALCACAGQPQRPTVPSTPAQVPARVTAQNAAATEREFRAQVPQSEAYEQLRAGLVAYLAAQSQEILARGDYDEVLEHTARISSLYTPTEFEQGAIPAALGPLAEFIVKAGEPRADEGAVLGALRILAALHPDDGHYEAYYKRLKDWSVSARAVLPNPLGLDDELIHVWTRHAILAPTPEVLSALARRHIEERTRFVRRFQMAEGRFTLSAREFEHIQNKSFDIAGVFLRHGDVASALSHLKAAGAAGSLDARLIELLEMAREDGGEGADALLALANTTGFRLGDPLVSERLCQVGMRAYRKDPRFLLCLGNLAATADDVDGTIAYYEQAIALSPDDRTLRDAYLYDLYRLLTESAQHAGSPDVESLGQHLLSGLKERIARWPDAEPPVSPAKLYLAVALADMNVGHAEEAEARLRESLNAEDTTTAHYQLGNLLSRLGRFSEAATHYQAALALSSKADEQTPMDERAELLERLGDAQRMNGDEGAAKATYSEGLALWERMLPALSGVQRGLARVRLGILQNRLGQHEKAREAFEGALEDAPGVAEVYKGILAHLVVTTPDLELATRVFHHAQRQLRLEPEWKVYLALWLQVAAGQAGQPAPEESEQVLADFQTADQWWGRLSAFGVGKLSYEDLVAGAQDVGQRAEAAFYEGARRLNAGDVAGARQYFEQVMATRIVNFYEYIMAQELLLRLSPAQP